MRLYTLRRHFGLKWKTASIPWRLIGDAFIFMIMMMSAYALVDYIDSNADISDRLVASERARLQAESSLAHCLNGGSLTGNKDGFIMCEKAYWVKF